MSPIEFEAPWSRSLKFTSSFTLAVLCGIFALGIVHGSLHGRLMQTLLIGFPIVVVLLTLPFAVLGYTLSQDEIVVKRMGWQTRLSLADLQGVEGKAEAMLASVPVFANGGLFSYCGFYWNRELRLYRALATDPSRAVVLRYLHRNVVITPHDPQHFIIRARTFLKIAEFPR